MNVIYDASSFGEFFFIIFLCRELIWYEKQKVGVKAWLGQTKRMFSFACLAVKNTAGDVSGFM